MVASVTPIALPSLAATVPTTFSTTDGATQNIYEMPLGTAVTGSDGRTYVLCKNSSGSTITTASTSCTVNASTFLITNSGGSYTPAVNIPDGSVAWASKALV